MHQYSPTGCKEYWVPNELIGMLGTCQTWYPVGQGTPSQNWYPIRNWYQAKQGVEPTNEFIGNSAVADLGRSMGVIAPAFEENFSIFPSKNERKMSSYYLKWASKIGFCLESPLPSKILDPPLLKRRLLNIRISNGLAIKLVIQSNEPKNIINAPLNVVHIVDISLCC